MLRGSSLKQLAQLGMAVKRGGASLRDRMDKVKKPYLGMEPAGTRGLGAFDKLYDLIRYPRL